MTTLRLLVLMGAWCAGGSSMTLSSAARRLLLVAVCQQAHTHISPHVPAWRPPAPTPPPYPAPFGTFARVVPPVNLTRWARHYTTPPAQIFLSSLASTGSVGHNSGALYFFPSSGTDRWRAWWAVGSTELPVADLPPHRQHATNAAHCTKRRARRSYLPDVSPTLAVGRVRTDVVGSTFTGLAQFLCR